MGVARQETKFAQVADIHDVYAVLTISKLDYGPAQQSRAAKSFITALRGVQMLGRRHQYWAGVDAGVGAGVGPKVGERIGGRVGVGVRPGARQEDAQGRAKGRAKGRSRKCKEGTQTRMNRVLFAFDGL